MGPDHSQVEIYNESKHGVVLAAQFVPPLLFPNLVGSALLGMWALLPHLHEAAPSRSWLGASYDWVHSRDEPRVS